MAPVSEQAVPSVTTLFSFTISRKSAAPLNRDVVFAVSAPLRVVVPTTPAFPQSARYPSPQNTGVGCARNGCVTSDAQAACCGGARNVQAAGIDVSDFGDVVAAEEQVRLHPVQLSVRLSNPGKLAVQSWLASRGADRCPNAVCRELSTTVFAKPLATTPS